MDPDFSFCNGDNVYDVTRFWREQGESGDLMGDFARKVPVLVDSSCCHLGSETTAPSGDRGKYAKFPIMSVDGRCLRAYLISVNF